MTSCGCDTCGGPERSAAEPVVTDLGDRLADWLEELHLAGHLTEAGLPTYVRDTDGRALWTDPATGLPMSPDQTAALDRQLRSEGDDPAYAVPVGLVQLARRARVRAALLASPWFTYESLAQVRGGSVNATRFAVHKANAGNELLLVANDEQTLIPGFQLTEAGAVRDELVPVLRPLLAAGMEPWDAWAWLTQPAGLLSGAIPAEAAADPAERALVAHASVLLAGRVVAEHDGARD